MKQIRGDPVQPRPSVHLLRVEYISTLERDSEDFASQVVRDVGADAVYEVSVNRDEVPIEDQCKEPRVGARAHYELRVRHFLSFAVHHSLMLSEGHIAVRDHR